ncbi:MAG: TAXI family TRAP transporter solute-binding subunit, partial [Candidatus Rokuibacteriota bacterium]
MKSVLRLSLIVVLLLALPAGGWAQTLDLKWGTSAAGSAGHRSMVNLASMLSRELPELRISMLPTPGAIVTVKGYATGQFDGYYGSD